MKRLSLLCSKFFIQNFQLLEQKKAIFRRNSRLRRVDFEIKFCQRYIFAFKCDKTRS